MFVCTHNYPAHKELEPYYIVICGLSGCTLFFTLSHEQHDFQKKKLLSLCVLIFSTTLSEMFLYLRKIQLDVFVNVRSSSCNVAVILGRFQSELNILDIEMLERRLS